MFSLITFRDGSLFDENGQAMADEEILFAIGYYISYRDLLKLREEKGFIDYIRKEADKCMDIKTNDAFLLQRQK